MLTHDTLESQTVFELPAREMMGIFSFNYASVRVSQTNANFQLGAVNVQTGQQNNAFVAILQ